MAKDRDERNGRPTRREFSVLSAAPAPPGWTAVYAEFLEAEEAGGEAPFPAGVRLYTTPVFAVVVVREVEYYADDGKAVPGCEWERVEMVDAEGLHDGFGYPWELDDFLGYAPPDYRFREGDRFWLAARRFWGAEEERHRASMARTEEFLKRRRDAS